MQLHRAFIDVHDWGLPCQPALAQSSKCFLAVTSLSRGAWKRFLFGKEPVTLVFGLQREGGKETPGTVLGLGIQFHAPKGVTSTKWFNWLCICFTSPGQIWRNSSRRFGLARALFNGKLSVPFFRAGSLRLHLMSGSWQHGAYRVWCRG